jgi:hypothetical protein
MTAGPDLVYAVAEGATTDSLRVEEKEPSAMSTRLPGLTSPPAADAPQRTPEDQAAQRSQAPRTVATAPPAPPARTMTPPYGVPTSATPRPTAPRPPAAATLPRAAAAAPSVKPAAPAPTNGARRAAAPAAPPAATSPWQATDDLAAQVSDALESLVAQPDAGPTPAKPRDVQSSPEDLAAARRVFEDLAIGHVAHVRHVMLELQLGDVACSWVESSRPALRSLRQMAEQMELAPLCKALDDFCAVVDAVIAQGGSQVGAPGKDDLMSRYQRLIELIPQAFELDGERDRREPIIVESLLRQVEGVETLTIDKLRAVGLGRLDTLLAASADEIAVTSGIRPEIAAAIARRLRTYRDTSPATVAAPDAAAAHREMTTLLGVLRKHHDDFERAAAQWSDGARADKRTLRKERDQTFLQIKVTLARMGERDRITRLEKVPFQERIADLERYLAALSVPNHGG